MSKEITNHGFIRCKTSLVGERERETSLITGGISLDTTCLKLIVILMGVPPVPAFSRATAIDLVDNGLEKMYIEST